MNPRQEYALTHPLNDASDPSVLVRYRSVRTHARGFLLMVILAVDR